MSKNNIDEEIKILLEMNEKPVEQNFRELTKELVSLNNDAIISDNDFNIILRRICSSYLESLVENFIIKKSDSIFSIRSLMS